MVVWHRRGKKQGVGGEKHKKQNENTTGRRPRNRTPPPYNQNSSSAQRGSSSAQRDFSWPSAEPKTPVEHGELGTGEGLGEDVGDIIVSGDPMDVQLLGGDVVTDNVVLNIVVFCFGVVGGIAGKSDCGTVVDGEGHGVGLFVSNGEENTAEPDALLASLCRGDVLSLGRRATRSSLLVCRPGDHPGTQREAVTADGVARVRATRMVQVGITQSECGARAAEVEGESVSAFQISDDMLGGLPVVLAVTVQELRELLHSERDVWARADHDVVQTPDKSTVGPSARSVLLVISFGESWIRERLQSVSIGVRTGWASERPN